MYQVNEIFSSLQGEGFNTGRKVVFVRLANCNLSCSWCDTEFSTYKEMTLEEIIQKVDSFDVNSVIITGGEPTIHEGFSSLVEALKNKDYWIAIETNGIVAVDAKTVKSIDYIATSPKAYCEELYEEKTAISFADEVRIVVDGDIENFCEFIENRVIARYYYLSPCSQEDGKFNFLPTIELLGKLNQRQDGQKWGLSFQTHKFANIE